MQLREFSAETIAVRFPNWIGDAVMATAAARELRRELPGARIVAVVRPAVGRLLAGLTSIDELFELDSRRADRGFVGILRSARRLRRLAPRLGILLPHSFSSALHFRLAGIRETLGYWTRERALLLRHAPRAPEAEGRRLPEPMPRHYLRLLASFGLTGRNEALELAISEEEEERAGRRLAELGIGDGEPFVALNPGASFGASKLWTVEGFRDTALGLHRVHGWRSLVLCGPGEESLAREIAESTARAAPVAVDSSRNPLPLELLKPVLRAARLLVTTDTGPRHIATAFGTPSIVLMGPTDPRYTATNLERTRVLRHEVDCGPCHLKVCPLDHRCMRSLGASDVLEAARALLDPDRLEDPSEPAYA